MSVEKVKEFFINNGNEKKVLEFEHTTATVEQAAEAIGCEPCRIAKTISLWQGETPVLIVMSGDGQIDNKKYKAEFSEKAKMIPFDQVETAVGYAPGGVCPFASKEGVKVYADVSLQKFDTFYPAAGSSNSAVEMTCSELERYAKIEKWIDVCKDSENEG
jgi:prolyl-tRNA editing enzyme YbaK/EbsC (Cys-tRNA(Pro) deacylase)